MNTARSITTNAFNIERGNYYPFGMEQPGRSYSSNSYRYGFNGMEKDDEIDGVSGSKLDFGARIYDSRLGRWLSTDPIRQSHESPYAFVADNPIIYVDKYGKDNVIYLVALPSSSEVLSKEDYQNIINEVNKNFDNLGVSTRVVLFESSDPFDPRHLDNNDSYVIIGSNSDIIETLESNSSAYEGRSSEDFRYAKGAYHIEESNVPGPGGVIDSDGIVGWSKELKSSKVKATSLVVLHIAGHNSGLYHNTLNWISKQAPIMLAAINPRKIYIGENGEIVYVERPDITSVDDIVKPENNVEYKNDLEKYFGSGESKANYTKNKETSESGAVGPRLPDGSF